MKFTLKAVRALAATLITSGSLAGGANGAALILVTQSGSDVVATATGVLAEPISISFSGGLLAPSVGNGFIGVGSTNRWNILTGQSVIGSFSGPVDSVLASSFSGARIGANTNGALLWGSETQWDTPINSSATWESTTLAALNFDENDEFSLTYLSLGGGTDEITVRVSTIPEPSSAVLLGLGALGLAARRRTTI